MNAIAVIPTQIESAAIESVLAYGDLTKLSSSQRTAYYTRVCESLGLNPLTRPFEFINLSGKLVFYARRDCTDQLRKIHSVSIQVVSRERLDDVYVVTSRASFPNGRVDEATGAVAIGNLKGEALANALMKAETKAKRRVTLSICGLSVLDETELESVRDATPLPIEQQPPRISPHDHDEDLTDRERDALVDPEELMALLVSAQTMLANGSWSAARSCIGMKGGDPGEFGPKFSAAKLSGKLSADYSKALGKLWGQLDRQIAKLEKADLEKPADVLDSLTDDAEDFQR